MNPKSITVPKLVERKNSGKKIVAVTSYDYCFSRILDSTDIDIVLVGDSLGMVSLGYENTLPVTMDEMIHHTRAVKRGIHNALLVGDMPFMSYQTSVQEAVLNAGRFVKEGGAEAVKMEGGTRIAEKVKSVVEAGIPVMGHVGLTPQSVHQFGGYRVQGKTFQDARQIKQDARELQKAGAFSIVLEGIPCELAADITEDLKIPTIGIGAGGGCDGQILVLHDLLGFNIEFTPKFVKPYANMGEDMQTAITNYIGEVRSGRFPGEEHSYHLDRKPLKSVSSKDCG